MLIAPSSPQLESLRPSGLILSDWTVPWCARRVCPPPPLCLSHQRSIPSLPPLTRTAPVGPQATVYTIPGCPDRTLFPASQAGWRSRLRISHTNTSSLSLLPPPEASHFPSRLQATSFTLL